MAVEYINVHTHHRTEDALCIVSYGLGRDEIPPEPERPFSAGIHPWDAEAVGPEDMERYITYLREAPVAAIGEAGLDYLRGGDHPKQMKVFTAQLDIARERSLPVIVHCVRAHNALFPAILPYPELYFILHGYTGSPEITKRALDTGCYFSFGERSLRSEKTRRSLDIIPPDRIFAETDESPVQISEIYTSLAQIKGISIEKLASLLEANYKKVFR